MNEVDEVAERLEVIKNLLHELEPILQTVVLNDTTIIDALAQMLGFLQHMGARAQAREKRIDELLEKVDRVLSERRQIA